MNVRGEGKEEVIPKLRFYNATAVGSLELDTTLEDAEAIKLAWQVKMNDLKVLMIVTDLHLVTH